MTREEPVEPDGGVATATDVGLDRAAAGDAGAVAQVATIARLEYRLSVRDRWALALTALFGLLAGVIVGFGGSAPGAVRVDAVVVSLASLATYLVPLAALVYGYDAVVGAEEHGWLEMVLAMPVPRWRVVVGTALGRGATLSASTVVGFAVGAVVLAVRADAVTWSLYATVVAGAVALGLAFLALGVLASTVAAEKTHALGASLLVWVWFVLGHDLAALGLVAGADLPAAALSALVLANPVDVFRVLVLSGAGATGGGMAAVVAESGLSRPALAVAAVVWAVAPVGLAAALFGRR